MRVGADGADITAGMRRAGLRLMRDSPAAPKRLATLSLIPLRIVEGNFYLAERGIM